MPLGLEKQAAFYCYCKNLIIEKNRKSFFVAFIL
jgi:hypothetical protein